jgi:hypothetical protein
MPSCCISYQCKTFHIVDVMIDDGASNDHRCSLPLPLPATQHTHATSCSLTATSNSHLPNSPPMRPATLLYHHCHGRPYTHMISHQQGLLSCHHFLPTHLVSNSRLLSHYYLTPMEGLLSPPSQALCLKGFQWTFTAIPT